MNTNDSLPLIIGLTGGIGSGKSIVSQLFSNHGVLVLDTDQLSRDLVKQSSPLLFEISEYFGEKILLESGDLDRKYLRRIIFADNEKKQWLEHLLHPKIRKLLLDKVSNCFDDYVVIVVPLLIESKNYNFINRILAVDCSEKLQLKRAMARDQNSSAEIKKILASQVSREKRVSSADDIIVNEGSLNSLTEKVEKLHEKYQHLSKQRNS